MALVNSSMACSFHLHVLSRVPVFMILRIMLFILS